MDRTDEVGAATAADYFLRLFAYVLVSGDLDEWNRVTIPDCEFCANAQSRVGAMAGNGRRLTGGAVALGAPEILGHDDVIGAYAVGVPYTFAAGAEVDAAGTTVRVIEQEEGYAVLDVVQSSEGWMLIEGSGGTEESE